MTDEYDIKTFVLDNKEFIFDRMDNIKLTFTNLGLEYIYDINENNIIITITKEMLLNHFSNELELIHLTIDENFVKMINKEEVLK